MDNKQKRKLENIIYTAVLFISAALFFFGFDEAAVALFGLLMLVYGVKDFKDGCFGRAALLLAVGALLVGVAVYERFN